jgi:hypothetical protein
MTLGQVRPAVAQSNKAMQKEENDSLFLFIYIVLPNPIALLLLDQFFVGWMRPFDVKHLLKGLKFSNVI